MSEQLWCWRGEKPGQPAKFQQMPAKELSAGEVLVQVHYSGVNYKDALAVTGKGAILRRFPLNAGIDLSGRVLESHDPRFKVGDLVVAHGCNIGENDDGGFAELARVKGASVMPLPKGLTTREAMLIGTAGFTAALALYRMEHNGQTPEMGPLLITGASGGVGSIAVQVCAQAGYEVIAVSGKAQSVAYLKELGAKDVITPDALKLGGRPLEGVRFGGAIDNVGGKMLSQLLAHIQLWGNVGSVGLAESAELNTTVMPFILRGVSLLGVSSNNTPMPTREKIWKELGSKQKPKRLEQTLARTIPLKDVLSAAQDLLARKVQGRILVEIRRES